MTLEEFNQTKATKGLTFLALKLCEKDMEHAMSHADIIAMLDKAGVSHARIGNAGRASNEDVAKLAAEYPDRLIPWFRIWGDEGERGVAALERGVRELGCRGFEISSYREERYINDPAYRPFLAKCVELDIPVRITAGVHLLSDRPYDYAHPRYLDELAIDVSDVADSRGPRRLAMDPGPGRDRHAPSQSLHRHRMPTGKADHGPGRRL